MRELTASEASRNFSAVLDCAERGEKIVVTRGGRRVAMIAAAPRTDGAALRAVFERWRGAPALDDAFGARIGTVREMVTGELDVDPWHD